MSLEVSHNVAFRFGFQFNDFLVIGSWDPNSIFAQYAQYSSIYSDDDECLRSFRAYLALYARLLP